MPLNAHNHLRVLEHLAQLFQNVGGAGLEFSLPRIEQNSVAGKAHGDSLVGSSNIVAAQARLKMTQGLDGRVLGPSDGRVSRWKIETRLLFLHHHLLLNPGCRAPEELLAPLLLLCAL